MHNQRVMVITGTRKSIGKYLAKYYIKKGFQVFGCSRTSCGYRLDNYKHFCLDVSNEVEVKKMFADIHKTCNRLDVLINNAGVHSVNYSLLTPLKTAQDIFSTNMMGTFLFCREAVKLMKKNRYGRIVNISTIAVPLCSVGSAIYCASKAAVEQFSKVLAKEVAADGIIVNILGLSIVKNSGMAENLREDAISNTLDQTILKSLLDLEDISHAIDFFISEKSRMVTSQTLYLGGT